MSLPAAPNEIAEARRGPQRLASALRWSGAAIIISVAIMRCCTLLVPQLVFDADPAREPVSIAMLGMSGSLFLDAVLLLGCILALLGEWRRGGGIDGMLVTMALIPAPIILWHGWNDAGDLWRGCTWLAAAVTCIAIAHLARERAMRIAVLAAMMAIVIPLLARGAAQMIWEHDATVAAYAAQRESFLQARGWEPGSPAARIYERRLEHREPTGWFPSTNIFGSMMGAASLVFVGLTVASIGASRRGKMQSGPWFLMLLLTAACAAGLLLTRSMGAVLASAAGFIVLLAGARRNAAARPSLAMLILLLAAATLLAVVIRGTVLPEAFLNERSLLFRWHYLHASASIIADNLWPGVGPDGFQPEYVQRRLPRNPEEVQSAHAIFTDWIATLGMAGIVWTALIVMVLLRSRRNGAQPNERESGEQENHPAHGSSMFDAHLMSFPAAIAALGLLPALVVEWAATSPSDLVLRSFAMAGYVIIATVIALILHHARSSWLRVLPLAAAGAILVHAQIEMTFFQGSSVLWMMSVIGLAGGAKRSMTARGNKAWLTLFLLGCVACIAIILVRGVLPARAQERAMIAAAMTLEPLQSDQEALDRVFALRVDAAEQLVGAYEHWPLNVHPLNAAAEQLLRAAEVAAGRHGPKANNPALDLIVRAEAIIDRAIAEHHQPSSRSLAMNICALRAEVSGDANAWSRAISHGRALAETDPHGVGAWKRLGDALWESGDHLEAAKAYESALRNSSNFALDPLKQLSDSAEAELRKRVETVHTRHSRE